MHVVVITYDWPPRNAISVHRPYSWAKSWSEAGIEITVLTAVKQSFDKPLDLHLPQLPIKVVEVRYGKISSTFGDVFNSPTVRSIAKKLKGWLTRYYQIEIDPRAFWYAAAKPHALELAKNADVVISTFGPAAAHQLASVMKIENPRLKWIADYRDLWSQRHTDNMPDKVRRAMRQVEISTVGALADVVTAVSDDMVVQLSNLLGKPVCKVPNGFDTSEDDVKARLENQLPATSGPLRIVYTGMIYRGHRNPTPLFEALVHLKRSGQIKENSVTVDFYGDRVEVASELAENHEFAPFIRLMGHVTREKALDAQRNAGLLLLLESPAPEARGVLTGKLFEYLVAGRPILCIGSRPEYEIGQVLQQTKTGVVIGPEQIPLLQDLLLEIIHAPLNLPWYKPELQEILKYSRKTQALDMLKEIIFTS
jgi:glycosyltransferase involved in cell wall biosynthesis